MFTTKITKEEKAEMVKTLVTAEERSFLIQKRA